MNATRILGIGLVAAALTGTVFMVRAQTATPAGQSAGVQGAGRLLARVASQLDLSPEQRRTIRSALAAERQTLADLLANLHTARINLRAAIQTPQASENEIRGAAAKVAAVEGDLAVERAKIYGKISPVLTADQLAKWKELQERVDDLVDGAIVAANRRLAQ